MRYRSVTASLNRKGISLYRIRIDKCKRQTRDPQFTRGFIACRNRRIHAYARVSRSNAWCAAATPLSRYKIAFDKRISDFVLTASPQLRFQLRLMSKPDIG